MLPLPLRTKSGEFSFFIRKQFNVAVLLLNVLTPFSVSRLARPNQSFGFKYVFNIFCIMRNIGLKPEGANTALL